MFMEGSLKRKIKRLKESGAEELLDRVAVEKRLNISVNGRHLLSLHATPTMIKELVTGFLLTEGVVKVLCHERMSIVYGEEIDVDVPAEGKIADAKGTLTSGCAGGLTYLKDNIDTVPEGFSIGAEALRALFRQFQQRSKLYLETGCVHSAALSDGREMLYFAEDIGRHNAADKVIGASLMDAPAVKGKPMPNLMLASGRLSSEMVSKCARWGIPVLASRAAPTDRAIDIAEKAGITVIGFLRGDRMNIYTHPARITA